ncbi:unnamed protein product, partial [Mesorhabditis spiculigera]
MPKKVPSRPTKRKRASVSSNTTPHDMNEIKSEKDTEVEASSASAISYKPPPMKLLPPTGHEVMHRRMVFMCAGETDGVGLTKVRGEAYEMVATRNDVCARRRHATPRAAHQRPRICHYTKANVLVKSAGSRAPGCGLPSAHLLAASTVRHGVA